MMEAVSLVCQLFGALVLAVNAAPYFWWGDAGQHAEVWSSSWTDWAHSSGNFCLAKCAKDSKFLLAF